MKNLFKKFIATIVLAIAFLTVGFTSDAAESAYTPIKVTDVEKMPELTFRTVTVPVNSSVVIPINIPSKGGIWLYHSYLGYDVDGKIYKDASCTIIHDPLYFTENWRSDLYPDTRIGDVEFDKGGTYYLKLENKNKYGEDAIRIPIAAYFFDGSDKDICSGKTYATYRLDNDEVLYKFKANKTGYINVEIVQNDDYPVTVKLLDSNKKELSNTSVWKSDVRFKIASFGVEKGKTYYIATFGTIKAPESSAYNVKYTIKSVKEKSGSKKSKAVTIKKNKTIKGIQIANGKKSGSDWYKIKLTKKQKINFYVKGNSNRLGAIKLSIIPANTKYKKYKKTILIPKNQSQTITTEKLPKGTYYIQVYKADKMASGYYTIKWN